MKLKSKNSFSYLVLTLLLLFLQACGNGSSNNQPQSNVLSGSYGDYNVTFTGQVGGPYEPSNSIVTGTTVGVVNFTRNGTITLSPPETGVIAVPDGVTIPGINADDIIYGAAVMQNPIRIFIGTSEASAPGDFGIHSLVRIGVPKKNPESVTINCSGSSAFSCSPEFFRRTDPEDLTGSVNLIYFVTKVNGNTTSFVITGQLIDRHISESAAANLFTVPIESPILGDTNDQFMFSTTTNFEITVSGNRISGNISATGSSVAGLAPQTAIFELSFNGVKN